MGSSHSKLQSTGKWYSSAGRADDPTDGKQEPDKWSKLMDYLTCPVCGDLFTDPYSFPCEHNVCGKCLVQVFGKGCANCVCPTCCRVYAGKPALHKNPIICHAAKALNSIRCSMLEPQTSASSSAESGTRSRVVPVPLVLEQVDFHDADRPSPASEAGDKPPVDQNRLVGDTAECDWCGQPVTAEAGARCRDCPATLCLRHAGDHQLDQQFARHNLTALSGPAGCPPAGPVPAERLCPRHSQRELTHYCCKELEMLCPLCIESDKHSGHPVQAISQLSKVWKESLENLLSDLNDLKEVTMVEVTEMVELGESIKLEEDTIREKCQTEFDGAIWYLTQEKSRQMKAIERGAKGKEEAVGLRLKHVTCKLDDCNQAIEDLRSVDLRDDFKFLRTVLEVFPSLENIMRPPDKAQDINEIKKDLSLAYQPPQLPTVSNASPEMSDPGPKEQMPSTDHSQTEEGENPTASRPVYQNVPPIGPSGDIKLAPSQIIGKKSKFKLSKNLSGKYV
ncbi:E3 ubiquitin/ISG15 ligase TRIM25-like [Heptranchias perlo]|uniref:E3 ubiquitin/ISG15 ligase TRIM25-like n=1 Tax=Heptranchias perlo TaxID=212740 RepID=UPI0035596CF2